VPTLSDIPTYKLSLSSIKVGIRGRKDFSNIHDLAENIAKHGLIHPILVRKNDDLTDLVHPYVLVSGERRLRAHHVGGFLTIEARIRESFPPGKEGELLLREMELDENIQRQDLSSIEKLEMLAEIHAVKLQVHGHRCRGTDGKWSMQDTADHVGVTKGMVSKRLSLAKVLKDRPDIRKKVAGMNVNQMTREVEKTLQREEARRLITAGTLKISNQLLQGDALVLIKDLKDSSVDLILTDPPFGLETIEAGRGRPSFDTASYQAVVKSTDNLDETSALSLVMTILPDLFRVLIPGSHCYIFTCYQTAHHIRDEAHRVGFQSQPELLTWFKGSTTAPFMGYRYAACSEPILFLWKPLLENPEGYGRKLNLTCKTLLEYKPDEVKVHPFQKPLSLLQFLIRNSSNKGQIVLDPFAGSGRTLEAALSVSRSAVGFELNKSHWTLAQAMLAGLNQETKELTKETMKESK
jgi:site-specific DNA-methyltransferase (adenine-specific)